MQVIESAILNAWNGRTDLEVNDEQVVTHYMEEILHRLKTKPDRVSQDMKGAPGQISSLTALPADQKSRQHDPGYP